MEYSLVMTTYNDAKKIESLLDNIALQTSIPSEIIIVDGGSTDDTCTLISDRSKNYPCKIRLLAGKRLNISEGLNVAIRECQFEYVGIVATGNRYEYDFFEILISKIILDNSDFAYGPIIGEERSLFSRSYNRALLNGSNGIKMRIPSNHGCMCRRMAIIELGLFYEKFIYAGEDAEFYERANRNGYKFSYAEKAKLHWSTPTSWKKFLKQIQGYVIAQMQMKNLFELLLFYRYGILLFLYFGGMIMAIPYEKKISVILLSMGMGMFLIKSLRIGARAYFILIVNNVYPLVCLLKKNKYLSIKYKVCIINNGEK